MTRPLPMPRRPSTSKIARSLASDRILKAVVHHDHARAVASRGFGAGQAVARDDGRRQARQEQRFVTDSRRRNGSHGIDAHRTDQTAAIAAASERTGVRARRARSRPTVERRRRLAGAADGEVAEANDRDADAASR